MDHSALTPAAPRGASFNLPHPNRRTLVKGVAWSAPVLAVATTAPALAASSPTGQCYPEGTLFDAQARGRLVSGAIGGINLDALAEVGGVHAQAFDPKTPDADSTDRDLKADPLTAEALSAIQLNLGGLSGSLSSILDLVTDQEVGAVNQYALATAAAETTDSADVGGAGTVSNSGTLELDTQSPTPPQLGTLNLKSILEEATGDGVAELVGSVADLTLEIGALGGLATVDSLCEVPETDQVDRDYVLASLKVNAQSQALGGILGAVTGALPEDALQLDTSAILGLLDDIPIVGDILAVVSGSLLRVAVTTDFRQLSGNIPTASGSAIQLNTGAGGDSPASITVDLAALLGQPYTETVSPWLNNLGPNTRLFVDAGLPADPVTNTVDSLIDSLVERVGDLVSISIRLGNMSITGLRISGTLNEFLDGTATAQYRLSAVGPIRDMTGTTATLRSIGDLLKGTIDGLLDDNAVLNTALESVNVILAPLFDVLSGVLAITVNAQNNSTGPSMPSYYQLIANPGRYDVAALHLEVLGVANLLNLSLGRGSVGENLARRDTAARKGIQLPF